jgi:hypothetical protein
VDVNFVTNLLWHFQRNRKKISRKTFTTCAILRTNRLRTYSFRYLHYFYDFCAISICAWKRNKGYFPKKAFSWTEGYTKPISAIFSSLFKSWRMYVFSIIYISCCELIHCNKIIHIPPFTTEIFIVALHIVQHVSTLIKAINMYYNLKHLEKNTLLYKHQVENKMRTRSWK